MAESREPKPLEVRATTGGTNLNFNTRTVTVPAINPDPVSAQPCHIVLSMALIKQVAGQIALTEGQHEAKGAAGPRLWRPG